MVIGCAGLLVLALGLAWTGLGGMRRGLRAAESLTLVRGIRRLVTAIALGVLALGLLTGTRGLAAFAVVFLGEELYETGVLLLIISRSEAPPARATPRAPPGPAPRRSSPAAAGSQPGPRR